MFTRQIFRLFPASAFYGFFELLLQKHSFRSIKAVLFIGLLGSMGEACPAQNCSSSYTIQSIDCNGSTYDVHLTIRAANQAMNSITYYDYYSSVGSLNRLYTGDYNCYCILVFPTPIYCYSDGVTNCCSDIPSLHDGPCTGTENIEFTLTGVPSGQAATLELTFQYYNTSIGDFDFCYSTLTLPAFYCFSPGTCTGNPLNYPWMQTIISGINCQNCQVNIYKRKYLGQDVFEVRRPTGCANAGGDIYNCSGQFLFTYSTTQNTQQIPYLQGQTLIWSCAANQCPSPPTASIAGATSTCSGTPATLTASATGGQSPYSYSWSTGSTNAAISVTPTVTTIYTVTVTDAMACTATASRTVTVLPNIFLNNINYTGLTGSFTVSGGQPQINGSNYTSVAMALQNNPAVTATLTTAPFTHNETVNFTVPQAGIYSVSVTDNAGCTVVKTILVPIPDNGTCLDVWTLSLFGAQQDLNSVCFSGVFGWVVGSNGTIRHSSDFGTSWSVQTSGTTNDLYDVAFASSSTGWAVGEASTVLKTTNGGTSWQPLSLGQSMTVRAVSFVTSQTGWVAGDQGRIRKTTNGGTSWSACTSGTSNNLTDIFFADSQTGWVVGDAGTIRRSTNGGTNWSLQNSNTTQTLNHVFFLDTQTGWAVGQGGTIRKTTNGGATWTTQNANTTTNLYGVYFTDALNGWIGGDGGLLKHTTDGGASWQTENSAITNRITGFHFNIASKGWATSTNDVILRYFPAVPPCVSITQPVPNSTNVPVSTSISWPEATGCYDAYNLQIGTTPNGSNIYSGLVLSDSYQPALPLPENTTIYVQITAVDFDLMLDLDGDGIPETVVISTGNGCQEYHFTTAPACQTPQSAFNYIVQGNTVTFTNNSTNATSYLWDFGDGNTSAQANPTHTYTVSGTYVVQLTASNGCGSSPAAHTVNTAPTAAFSADPTTGCASLLVQYVNESSSNATSYQWQFPGGTPGASSQPNPVVLYTVPGVYSATLRATNAAGQDTTIKTNLVTVLGIPVSSFAHAEAGLSVSFTNTSTGADTYLWDFGDGNTSTQANPNHTYSAAGTYQVCLTTTNGCGNTQTCKNITLANGGGGCNPVSDSLELVAFFNATGGPGWTNKTNWLAPGKAIDTWWGILTNAEGCLTKIDLDNNNLTGSIPNLDLPNLQLFFCFGNNLGGMIPNFDKLPNLLSFDCNENNLSGTIPNFDNLPKLQSFFCNYNDLAGTIPDFGNFPNLVTFDCSYNNLNGTIPNFNNLPKLQDFNCNNNDLAGTVPNFNNLPNLQWLDCSNNNLSGAIPNFDNLQNLRFLYCYTNSLSGTIPDFSNLPNLQEFNCSINDLSGNIPDFTNLPQLRLFGCSINNLNGTLPNFSNLPQLLRFSCSDNNLSGTIPNFNNLTALQWFDCYVNNLSGTIPNFDNLPNLKRFECSGNNLSGTIPNFDNLPKLERFECSSNNLSGTIPEFNNQPNLSSFNCMHNRFVFENILPSITPIQNLISANLGVYYYAPQDSIFSDTLITRITGQSLTIDLGIDSGMAENQYQWYHNGSQMPMIVGNNKLVFSSLSLSDAGEYWVRITNPNAPLLTLKSYKITLNVVSCANSTPPLITGPIALCSGVATLDAGSFTQYTWSNNSTTQTINVTQPGTYTVTVTDSNGCTGTDSQIVGASVSPPLPNISGPTALCSGSATLAAGTFAQYAWSNNASTSNISITQPGVYTVTVTDSNGCTGTDSQTVGASVPPPLPDITGPTALCSGAATLSAGTFAQYAWSNSAGTSSINVTQPGAYTVTVTDTNGCTGTDSQNIGATVQPPAVAITGPIALCSGLAVLDAGSFTQYTWSEGSNTPQVNVTASGAYTVTVTDANGCTGTDTHFVGASVPAPAPTITGPLALCSGSADLDAGAYAQYQWSTGASTAVIHVLQSNTYTVTVTDTNGCTGSGSRFVDASVFAPLPAISGPTALCSGTATLNAGTYTQYIWSTGAITPAISVSQLGNYSVTVTDANGCTGTDSQLLSVNVSAPLPAITGPVAICTAPITLNAGAFAQYAWTGGATSASLAVTQAGVYAVTATDAYGCTGTDSHTVSAAAPPIAQLLVAENSGTPGDLIVCAGDGAVFTAGGGIQYQFWVNGVAQTPGLVANNTLSLAPMLTNTTVAVLVADANACQDTTQSGEGIAREPVSVAVASVPDVSVLSASLVAACPGEPVELLLHAPGMQDGTYIVTYKINNSNAQTASVAFSGGIGILPLGQLSPQTGATCQIQQIGAGSTGCVATMASGNALIFNVLSPIQTSLDTTICVSQSIVINGQVYAQAGSYTIPLTTPAGCDSTVILNLQTVPQFNRTETATICAGDQYQFYGNTLTQQGAYQHVAAGPFGCDTLVQLSLFEKQPVFSFLNKTICPGALYQVGDSVFTTPGFYQVTLPSAFGCDSIVNLNLQVSPVSLSFPQPAMTICQGENAALVPLVQGCQNCQYEWSTGATQANTTVAPGASAQYGLTITDANNCSAAAMIQVDVQPAYDLDREMVICPGDTIHAGGQTITKPGSYHLEFQTASGCDSMVLLTLHSFDVSQLVAEPDTVLMPPDGSTSRDFNVSDNDFIDRDYRLEVVQNPVQGKVEVLNKNELRYTLTNPDFYGYDSLQYRLCPLTDCPETCTLAWAYVRAQAGTLEEAKKRIPNVITPNGDGFNDLFDPVQVLLDNGIEIGESELFLVNRWGETVFHRQRGFGEGNAWDGKQGDIVLPQATYYYRLRLVSGEEFMLKGAVNLLR